MLKTDTLKLPLYEMDDMANLTDGYNEAMRKIDAAHEKNESRFPISSENIEDGGINTVDIANGAVTENKVATAAITPTKLAEGAVTAQALAEGAVTAQALAEGAVTAQALAEGAVDRSAINQNAVDNIVTQGSNNLVSSDAVYDAVSAFSLFGNYAEQKYTVPSAIGNGYFNSFFSPNRNYMRFYGQIILANSQTLVQIPGTEFYGIDTGIIVPFDVPTARILYGTIIRTIKTGTDISQRLDHIGIGTDKHIYLYVISTPNFTITPGTTHYGIIPQQLMIANVNGFDGVIDAGEELA